MSGYLAESAYGKVKIRVMKVNRNPNGRHEVHEVTVQTMLWGDFADSWTTGSNKKIIATETQKNTVYQLAKQHDLGSVEEFGKLVASHFLKKYDWITKVQVTLREDPWGRVQVDGKDHNHAFTKTTTEKRFAEVTMSRGAPAQIIGGIEDLIVLKTTQSSFECFVGCKGGHVEHDEWTTLKEAKDRLFSTAVKSYWTYSSDTAPFNDCYDKVKHSFLTRFAGDPVKGVPSPAAQQTQYQMCLAALEANNPHLADISITTPNLHYNPLSSLVTPPSMHAPNNDVFYPIDGPSGYITSKAALRRAKM
eukprot:CAMPEP_0202821776 /NCGR_PEP_ID=MMETSP1389-20130828/10601_1 /ASSEMBLY_ACC=CAM_ASM_000865 /TAXON_ID=302021 /ORGANISM="Rhodomonas sp., Strain CCMP768" /LENGTH=304 /DNA_ID=CAMNT_0049494597 /DNA_START=45 /DNA_END=959 /DNA_ORIENTATION=-